MVLGKQFRPLRFDPDQGEGRVVGRPNDPGGGSGGATQDEPDDQSHEPTALEGLPERPVRRSLLVFPAGEPLNWISPPPRFIRRGLAFRKDDLARQVATTTDGDQVM